MMAVSTDNSKSSGSKTSNSAKTSTGTSKVSAADLGTTVRMYLSCIGSVDLLSRDEEVEIAMQIEEARDAVIDAHVDSA